MSLQTKLSGKKKFSSTLVRELISRGELKKATTLLGRPVAILGKVVAGDSRGRTIGFPTANIVPAGELTPPQGVYVERVNRRGKQYQGMANVGVRPSFYKEEHLTIEVNIFDFNSKIYGDEIIIEFLSKSRNEMYFPSREALIMQLKKDEAFSRKWFAQRKQ